MDEEKLSDTQVEQEMEKLSDQWSVVGGKLHAEFKLGSFSDVIGAVNSIAEAAEEVNHHPDIHIYFKKLVIDLWTHKFSGLSDKDFHLAKKIGEIVLD